MQTVHVRVNDRASGEATPVRLRIASADGVYHAPFGRLARFATGAYQDVGGNLLLGDKAYAYIDGSCEVQLPSGPLKVHLDKGPEYLPRVIEYDQPAGKISLRLDVERWTDLRREGWYSGDFRAHALTPHAGLLEGQAENLAVVNLLAEEVSRGESWAIPNIVAFSGQTPILEKSEHIVVVNTHNRHPVLGSLGLLHSHRAVYPLRFGSPHSPDNWTLLDWCQQCHRKQGLVVWSEARQEHSTVCYGEPLADLLLGQVDALELTGLAHDPADRLALWYLLLNCGFRVPLVGSSGKDSNTVALGAMRTYARLQSGQNFNYKNWIDAVRSGRSFVTNGPLVSLTVDGHDPGSVLTVPASGTVTVQATARSALPFEQLQVVVNGTVVAGVQATGSPIASAEVALEMPIDEPCWIAARCPTSSANDGTHGHTSAVYVDVPGVPFPRDEEAVREFEAELDHLTNWAQHQARCPEEKDRERLLKVFGSAREALRVSR
jgi:hypothetical protein